MKNPSFLGKFLFTVCFLSNFLYAAEETAENALTASFLPLGISPIDELSEEERSWFDRLNAEEIIHLNGKPWEKHHPEIISYLSLYEAFYLLQEQPAGFEGLLERNLIEAFHPDFAGKYHVLGMFYQMIKRDIEDFRAFHTASELGDKLSQKLIVDAINCSWLCQDKRPEEEWYQGLISLAERGEKIAQDQVVEVLYSGKLGWDKKPGEERYRELIACAEKGWGSTQGYGSGLVKVPDIFLEWLKFFIEAN